MTDYKDMTVDELLSVDMGEYNDPSWRNICDVRDELARRAREAGALRAEVARLTALRQHGCECSDDDACLFARERDEARAALAKANDRLCVDPGGSDRIDELEQAVSMLRAALAKSEELDRIAAGELLVEYPQPTLDGAAMLRANVILRTENSELRATLAKSEAELAALKGWLSGFRDRLTADHESHGWCRESHGWCQWCESFHAYGTQHVPVPDFSKKPAAEPAPATATESACMDAIEQDRQSPARIAFAKMVAREMEKQAAEHAPDDPHYVHAGSMMPCKNPRACVASTSVSSEGTRSSCHACGWDTGMVKCQESEPAPDLVTEKTRRSRDRKLAEHHARLAEVERKIDNLTETAGEHTTLIAGTRERLGDVEEKAAEVERRVSVCSESCGINEHATGELERRVAALEQAVGLTEFMHQNYPVGSVLARLAALEQREVKP